MDNEEEDRISELQEGLLIDIISRLDCTKEAIRSGTLSKRWQHIWPYAHTLVFSYYLDFFDMLVNHQRLSEYVSFVDKTLTQCRHLNLNKFQLHIPYYTSYAPQVNDWVRYAVSRKVKDFILCLGKTQYGLKPEFVLFDEIFFTKSCFTSLLLDGCLIIPPGDISWSRLKKLDIARTVLEEDLIQSILSGCPLLETLKLVECYGYKRLDITSKSVKRLVFSGYQSPWDDIVEIDAPYVLSLTIQSHLFMRKLLLLNVSSVVEAMLDYHKRGDHTATHKEEKEEMFKGLILKLRNVKELTIGSYCQKLFTRLKAEGLSFPSNIKYFDRCNSSEEDEDEDEDRDKPILVFIH